MIEKLTVFLNGEKYQTLGIVFSCLFLFTMFSCESKTHSLKDPTRKVNQAELMAEFDFITAQMAIRINDIDKQNAFKQMISDNAVLIGSEGQINLAGIITTLAAIFGIGAVVDNVRKRKAIANGKETSGKTNTNLD